MGCREWAAASALAEAYHNTEWGVPVHDDRMQFESLSLEVLQCGLRWELILRRREVFRRCFDRFDYDRVARYGDAEVNRILETDGMIRSERKIRAIIGNAACFQNIRSEFGSFSDYIWSYTDEKTILYEGHGDGAVPSSNVLSAKISRDLKSRGFAYMGPVTVYSHLQACGIINDHKTDCPCYGRILSAWPCVTRERCGEKF